MKLFLDINGTKKIKNPKKINEYTEVELGKDNNINLTHTFDSLQNPVDYVSEYSYEVKIPKTKFNNTLFDHFFKVDNFIGDEGFNPNKKLKYYIENNYNDIISRGTCFLNYIDEDFYYFNMLGSLNYLFNTFLNSGWDSNRRDDNYYYTIVDYLKYNGVNYTDNVVIDRNVVGTSWMIDPQKTIFDLVDLQNNYNHLADRYFNVTNKNIYLANIIGFAVENQGRYKDFHSDKWIKNINLVNQEVNVLTDGSNPDFAYEVGDGLVEGQMCEYRSYEQQPYIYVKRLLQIYQSECKAMSGYNMIFDSNWYNEENSILNNLVYMLPKLKKEGETTNTLKYTTLSPTLNSAFPSRSNFNSDTQKVNGIKNTKLTFTTNEVTDVTERTIEVKTKLSGLSFNFNKVINDNYGVQFNEKVPLIMRTNILDVADDSIVATGAVAIMFIMNGHTIEETKYKNVYDNLSKRFKGVILAYYTPLNGKQNWDITIGEDAPILTTKTILNEGQKVKLKTTISYESNTNEITPFKGGDGSESNDFYLNYFKDNVSCSLNGSFQSEVSDIESNRSYRHLTMEELFNDIKPFSIILKFTKLFGMLWVVDDYGKRVTLYDRETYFKKVLTTDLNSKVPAIGDVSYMGVLDITPIVDKSKNTKLTTPSWADKYLEFNFNESEIKYLKSYEEKYDLTFGSKKIITTNEKNSNTHKIFCRNEYDTINASIISGEYLKSVDSYINNENNYIQNYPQIVNMDDDGEGGELWNNFYFRNPNGVFNSDLGFNYRDGYVIISDDYQSEINFNSYSWHSAENNEDLRVAVRPIFDTITNNFSIHFANTREVYNQTPINPNVTYLYDRYFKNYIEQVYNEQSKKYEVYIAINSMMYRRLKINPFVSIENNVFLCSQIEDWNESKISTKLTLIKIEDLNQLTNYQLPTIEETFLNWDNNNKIAFDSNDNIII